MNKHTSSINDAAMPHSQDWNRFWEREKLSEGFKPSWSKQRIMRCLEPYLVKGNTVLDAGCGSGFFSKFFCDARMKTFALDYSEEALKKAKNMTHGRAGLLQKDLLADDDVADITERFDLIFSDGLFEHFSSADQDKILRNLTSLLSDAGVVVTFVPNRWSPWELIRPFYMPGIVEKPFVLKGLLDLSKRNGLTVVRSGGINTLPFPFSPDRLFGRYFGMLLYTIAKKRT